MIETCDACGEDFLTEADPYVVWPTPNGRKLYCQCHIGVARPGEGRAREVFVVMSGEHEPYVEGIFSTKELAKEYALELKNDPCTEDTYVKTYTLDEFKDYSFVPYWEAQAEVSILPDSKLGFGEVYFDGDTGMFKKSVEGTMRLYRDDINSFILSAKSTISKEHALKLLAELKQRFTACAAQPNGEELIDDLVKQKFEEKEE